jgi:hypothetical protein
VFSAGRLVELLVGQGRVDEAISLLQVRADAGDGSAAWLVELLAEQDRVEELRLVQTRATDPPLAGWSCC